MRQTHEADWGARSNSQCVDDSYVSSLPHKMVYARKIHTFIHQLCLESVIVPERRVGNMASLSERGKGAGRKSQRLSKSKSDLEIRLQGDTLQPSHQLTAAITSQ